MNLHAGSGYYNDDVPDVPTEYWEPSRPSADDLEDELPF